jgi:hypothetical protein
MVLSPPRYYIITASKDPKVGKHSNAGNRKHKTLMVLQILEIIRGLEIDKSQSLVNNGWPTIYNIKNEKDPITILYDIKRKCKGPFNVTDTEMV